MIPATTFAGKTVAVFGLGGSGLATAQALIAGGATVAAWDDGEAGRMAAADRGIPIVDLSAANWSQFSSLVLAPGVPLTHPEPHWVVLKARDAGIEIIGDIEIFARERVAHCPDAPFIAITGTNGKSTTTALVSHILREAGHDVQMGGNIGRAILTLEPPVGASGPGPERQNKDIRFHVIEMSSFQIDLTPTLKPTVGVLLNITPDHIDRHGTVEHYADVKERLISGAEVAVVGVEDNYSLEILKRRAATGPVAAISVRRPIMPGYCLNDGWLICSDATGLAVRLGTAAGISTLRGNHNAQNALAAVAAVRECLNAIGRPADFDWQQYLASYPGLPHRMEEIGRIGTALFINDSKATNADSTGKALLSWDRNIYWIAGGKPKEGGIASLAALFSRIAKAYLIGAATEEFAATLDGKVPFERCGTLDVAVAKAAAETAASGAKEPVVLLSPACASYDQFKNFEVRGDAFAKLVLALPGIVPTGGSRA